jgi:hypothetical protein
MIFELVTPNLEGQTAEQLAEERAETYHREAERMRTAAQESIKVAEYYEKLLHQQERYTWNWMIAWIVTAAAWIITIFLLWPNH